MTEAEWLACTDPRPMLDWLARRWRRRFARWCGLSASPTTRRKLWLFAGACCVRSTQGLTIPWWDDELRNLVALGKGEIDIERLERLLDKDRQAWVSAETWAMWRAESAGKHRALKLARDPAMREAVTEGREARSSWDKVPAAWAEERKAQSHFLRDIFGSPFHPSPPLPASILAWNGGTVPQIAQVIDAEEAFDRLPILADALEDAGCHDTGILVHCRQPGEHVRGCWVVNLLLGRT
jgi:hypothetical protein